MCCRFWGWVKCYFYDYVGVLVDLDVVDCIELNDLDVFWYVYVRREVVDLVIN